MSASLKPLQYKVPEFLYKGRVAAASMMIGLLLIYIAIIMIGWPDKQTNEGNLSRGPGISQSIFLALSLGAICIIHLISGIRDWIDPSLNTEGPGPFQTINDVWQGMCRNPITTYSEFRGLLRFFGNNTTYLPPLERKAFIMLTSSLVLRGVVVFLVLMLTITYIPADASGLLLLYGLVLPSALALIFALRILAAFRLVPKGTPDLGVDMESAFYQGYGNPTHIYTQIPMMSRELNRGPYPNRYEIFRNADLEMAVKDTSTFQGSIFIEQQPELDQSEINAGGKMLVNMGWALQLAGGVCACLILLSSISSVYFDAGFAGFSWTVFLAGAYLMYQGTKFFQYGERIVAAMRFRSMAIFIGLEGAYARASVSVGNASHDSINSANLTIRSDFTATFMAAELLSEAESHSAKRVLLSMNRTQECHRWVAFFKLKMDELRHNRVTPLGINWESEEFHEIAKANKLLSAVERTAADLNRPISKGSNPQPELLAQSTVDNVDKICPDCAESVKSLARKCRFCGFVFEFAGEP